MKNSILFIGLWANVFILNAQQSYIEYQYPRCISPNERMHLCEGKKEIDYCCDYPFRNKDINERLNVSDTLIERFWKVITDNIVFEVPDMFLEADSIVDYRGLYSSFGLGGKEEFMQDSVLVQHLFEGKRKPELKAPRPLQTFKYSSSRKLNLYNRLIICHENGLKVDTLYIGDAFDKISPEKHKGLSISSNLILIDFLRK